MRNLAAQFRAVADETRLLMLALLLRHDELCVCDFVYVLDITQSKASRHLRYLANAGFLEDRRDGVWSHYRISHKPDAAHREILNAVGSLVGDRRLAALDKKLARWLKEKGCGPLAGTLNLAADSSR